MAQSARFNFSPLSQFYPTRLFTDKTTNNDNRKQHSITISRRRGTRRQETKYTERIGRKNAALHQKDPQRRHQADIIGRNTYPPVKHGTRKNPKSNNKPSGVPHCQQSK